jgi:hypothetical protein
MWKNTVEGGRTPGACASHVRTLRLKTHTQNMQYFFPTTTMVVRTPLNVTSHVHSVQQKSLGQKFSKSLTANDVRYSCHHNSSRFTFPISPHSWRFPVFHSLQSITPGIYEPKTTIHLLNLKLKH